MKRKIFRIICILIVIACLVYLGISLYKTYKAQKDYEELRKIKEQATILTPTLTMTPTPTSTPEPTPSATPSASPTPTNSPTPTEPVMYPEYETLYNKNKDFIGWIRYDDTVMDYPVMHVPNEGTDFFYLRRDFNKKSSTAGCIFVDGRCNPIENRSQNVIIYGHNMRAGTMFAPLHKLEDKKFYESHKIIEFDTLYSKDMYEIVGVFNTKVYQSTDKVFKIYNFINAKNKEEYDEFAKYVKESSMYDTGVSLQYGDETITLMTCVRGQDEKRFVVVAKKIRPVNPDLSAQ